MVKQTIRIFCRIKPTKQNVGLYEIDDEASERSLVSFHVPKQLADGIVNNKKENYDFSFDKIFDQSAKQDDVFGLVAQPVIDNVLYGFNGTIFAYGQTGSGKTFTITGGAERYADRGIIPRCLSYVFQHISKNSAYMFTVHISYLEIYNEFGYDLLDPKHEATKLEDLPKVSLLEDNDGNIHLKNLSLHHSSNEEEALNLLFLGDTNRMIAETPMNQASTRSHCIFTIHVSVTEPDSATLRRSKLHLVDLAGSERVSKTGVGGTLLKEAKYINLSLHFLEQVIIALSEKSRNHIPYRNSMMTSVLRDSLGGNCMTSMIATCSVDKKNIDESISTCRFAQRVALIKNDAILNEELDPKLMIAKLKKEIQQLKDELALATGKQYDEELAEDEKERLQNLVLTFIEEQDPDGFLSVGADMRKINYCFQLLKKHCVNNIQNNSSFQHNDDESKTAKPINPYAIEDNTYLADKSEIQKLKDLILQRDNEINILVTILKKERQRAGADEKQQVHQALPQSVKHINSSSGSGLERDAIAINLRSKNQNEDHPKQNSLLTNLNLKTKASMSMGRQEAFEIFKRDYYENHIIKEHKQGLKNRYTDAKKLGEQVNKSREAINTVKAKLEKMKIRRSLKAASVGNLLTGKEGDEEELSLRKIMDEEKINYKKAFNELKMLKTEIEHMQHLLEKAKVKLQKDFELWWSENTLRMSNEQRMPSQDTKMAWKTPPITPKDSGAQTSGEKRKNSLKETFYSQPSSRSEELNDELSRKTSKSTNVRTFINTPSDKSSESLASRWNRNKTDIFNSGPSHESHSSLQAKTNHSGGTQVDASSDIRLTGDKQADEDILAFMKAREELMRKGKLLCRI